MAEPTETAEEIPQPTLIQLPTGVLFVKDVFIQFNLAIATEDGSGEPFPVNIAGQNYTLEQAKAFFEVQWPAMFESFKAMYANTLAEQATAASVNNRANRRTRTRTPTSKVVPIKKAAARRKPTRKR